MTLNSKIFKRISRKISLWRKNTSLFFYGFNKKVKKTILMNWTYPKKILLGLLIILIVGTCLLYNPAAYTNTSYEYVNNSFTFKYNGSIQGIPKSWNWNFIQALFLAASAFTNSGFSLIDLGKQLSFFGQFVVFVLIELGGFGWASFFYLIGKALNKMTKKNILSSAILDIERGGTKATQSPAMIIRIFFVIVSIQIIFTFVLSGLFYSMPFYEQQTLTLWASQNDAMLHPINSDAGNSAVGYSLAVNSDNLYFTYHNYANSFWAGLFMSASSLNNAGIDLFGTHSLAIFRNDNGIIIQCIIFVMMTIGGIGFPIIYDLNMKISWYWNYYIVYKLFHKKSYLYDEKPRFSSFTKICISTSLIMIVVVLSLVYLSEYTDLGSNTDPSQEPVSIINYPDVLYSYDANSKILTTYYPFGDNHSLNKNFALFFMSMSTRSSAGFATLSMQNFNESTVWILIFSMFIGASPSSTGGGVRVTTIAILFRSITGLLRGVNKVSLFKRNIPARNIIYSFVVLIVSISLILLVSLIIFLSTDTKDNIQNVSGTENFWWGSKTYSYSYYIFEAVSAFGTCGLSSGLIYTNNFGWWNDVLLIILMFIGQMGMYTALTSFSRKVPKKKESYYLEEYIRIA